MYPARESLKLRCPSLPRRLPRQWLGHAYWARTRTLVCQGCEECAPLCSRAQQGQCDHVCLNRTNMRGHTSEAPAPEMDDCRYTRFRHTLRTVLCICGFPCTCRFARYLMGSFPFYGKSSHTWEDFPYMGQLPMYGRLPLYGTYSHTWDDFPGMGRFPTSHSWEDFPCIQPPRII